MGAVVTMTDTSTAALAIAQRSAEVNLPASTPGLVQPKAVWMPQGWHGLDADSLSSGLNAPYDIVVAARLLDLPVPLLRSTVSFLASCVHNLAEVYVGGHPADGIIAAARQSVFEDHFEVLDISSVPVDPEVDAQAAPHLLMRLRRHPWPPAHYST